jgi:hypothetical protein
MSIVLKGFEADSPYQVRVLPVYNCETGSLEVEWQVSGPLPSLSDQVNALGPRTDKLWLDTVFEVFGRFGDSLAYWETNLSPSGAWNAYEFDAYRAGMQLTDNVSVVALRWGEREAHRWRFSVGYSVRPAPLRLNLGFACIFYPGPYHYAVRHAEAKPDFHAPESFAVMLSSLTP